MQDVGLKHYETLLQYNLIKFIQCFRSLVVEIEDCYRRMILPTLTIMLLVYTNLLLAMDDAKESFLNPT